MKSNSVRITSSDGNHLDYPLKRGWRRTQGIAVDPRRCFAATELEHEDHQYFQSRIINAADRAASEVEKQTILLFFKYKVKLPDHLAKTTFARQLTGKENDFVC
jgi:hypothetical protein